MIAEYQKRSILCVSQLARQLTFPACACALAWQLTACAPAWFLCLQLEQARAGIKEAGLDNVILGGNYVCGMCSAQNSVGSCWTLMPQV